MPGKQKASVLLIDNAIGYPADMNIAVGLTPFASGMRYHDLPTDATGDDAFDHDSARRVVQVAIDWASAVVDAPKQM
jgi:hypothetical protein